MKKRDSMMLKESAENAKNGPPADTMTLTCSTCNRQFRARIGLVSHLQEIMMVNLISERRTTNVPDIGTHAKYSYSKPSIYGIIVECMIKAAHI